LRIRIAAVIDTLGRGGAERLLVDTARLLDRSRFEMGVYTLFSRQRDYETALRDIGVDEVCLDLGSHRNLPTGVRRLRASFRQHPPDVVHTHLFASNVVGRLAARLVERRVVSTSHDADYESVVRLGNPGLTRPKQMFLRLTDALTAAVSGAQIVAVSEYVAHSAARRLWVGRERIEVIPNCVDTDRFCPDETRRQETRAGLSLSAGATVVICIGRMTPQKGQAVLIRALARAQAMGSPLRLLLAGEGACRPAYEALTRELGLDLAVSFLGSRWDVPDLLRAADILCLPSLHEGFGIVLVEALASGIPIIASRTGPTPEIILEGETGLLVEPNDPDALAAALAALAADPARRRAMGDRGRQDAVLRFALPPMVRRLEALYERIVLEDRRPLEMPEGGESG